VDTFVTLCNAGMSNPPQLFVFIKIPLRCINRIKMRIVNTLYSQLVLLFTHKITVCKCNSKTINIQLAFLLKAVQIYWTGYLIPYVLYKRLDNYNKLLPNTYPTTLPSLCNVSSPLPKHPIP